MTDQRDAQEEPDADRGSPTPSGNGADLRFVHEADRSRYALYRGADLVSVLDYRDDGRSLALVRAYTVPTFRGNGYAAELVSRAVSALEEDRSRAVVPVCWYVAQWFDEHPGHEALLQRRAG